MAKTIEARVIQKVTTEAEWLNVTMPLYNGEIALVRSGDRVVNMKVGNGTSKFSELNYIYEGGFNGSINPSTDTSGLMNGFYFAEISGSYPNANNIVVREGYYTVLEKTSTGWKKSTEVKMPTTDLTPINNRLTTLETDLNVLDNTVSAISDDVEDLKNNSSVVDQTYNPNSSLAQSGKAVNEAVEKSAIPDDWFNYSEDGNVYFDFNLSAGQVLTNGTFNTSTNWLRATVNGINVTNKITIQGLGGFDLSSFQPPYVRVAFYNGGLFLNYIAWIDGVNSLEVAVPSNATKMEIQVAGGNGVGLNLSTSPYLQKLKVFRVVGDDNPKESIKVEYVKDAVTLGDLDNIKIKDKYLHFSFDDVVLSLKDLTTNQATYTSIFNNVFFAELKRLHDTYKAVFSLYCFTETTGWNISDFPTKYAQEIKDNSDWLKFGFHTKNSSTNYQNASATVIKTDYDYFINEFYSKTGSINSIDRVVRLQNFLGNLDAVKAIRDTNCGVLGLLTADDNRSSYYLNTEQVSYINSHDSFLDSVNYLKFFKTEQRLEGVSNITTYLSNFLTPSFANQSKELILFTHEIELYATAGGSLNNTMKSKMENCFSWAKNNNYSFRFPTIN